MTWEGNEGSGIFWRSYRCNNCGIVSRQNINVIRQVELPPPTGLVLLEEGMLYRTIQELLDGTNVDAVSKKQDVFLVIKKCLIDFEIEYGVDHTLCVMQVAGGGRCGWVVSTEVITV